MSSYHPSSALIRFHPRRVADAGLAAQVGRRQAVHWRPFHLVYVPIGHAVANGTRVSVCFSVAPKIDGVIDRDRIPSRTSLYFLLSSARSLSVAVPSI